MAIFSRRVLQYMINENAKILSKDQLDKHIRNLNKADEKSLGYEWEVALLYAFSQIGMVIHEPNLGGTSKIDLQFITNHKPSESLIADITTVSDKGYEVENPQEDLINEFLRIIRKHKLRSVHFSIEIEGEHVGPFRNGKMKLKLPLKAKLQNIFDEKFHSFLKTISQKPYDIHAFVKKTNSIDISINYDPKQNDGFNWSYPSYTTAYSLKKNPVYNALKDKASQLKKTNYDGSISIILCDGGCRLLKDIGHKMLNYDLRDIIQHFLSKNSSISFVLTFVVERAVNQFKPMGDPYIKIRMFPNISVFENVDKNLLACINNVGKMLPKPVTDAMNATNRLKGDKRNEGLSFYGGWEMANSTIRISSRALHDLLAGRVDQKTFLEDHQLIPTQTRPTAINYFEFNLREGRMIEEIRVEKSKVKDDDWLVIKFGNPDSAISPFKLPSYYWLLKIKQKLWSFLSGNIKSGNKMHT